MNHQTALRPHAPERDIAFYVDQAMRAQGFTSKRALCAALGVTHGVISHWEKAAKYGERTWGYPKQTTMLRLAELAGIPAELALMDLASWTAVEQAKPMLRWQASVIWDALVAQGRLPTKLLPLLGSLIVAPQAFLAFLAETRASINCIL
jgi:hypothetical protein